MSPTIKLPRGVSFVKWRGSDAVFRVETWRTRWEMIKGIRRGLTPPYPGWDEIVMKALLAEISRRTDLPLVCTGFEELSDER